MTQDCSRLRRGTAEIHGKGDLLQLLDLAVGRFEALDVLGEGFHEPLGMLGSEDDPGFDLALGGAGHHVHEIDHELGMGMGDDGQVGIGSLGHFFRDLDVQLVVWGVLLLHKDYLGAKNKAVWVEYPSRSGPDEMRTLK
jgi:hypothetical protein